MINVLILEDETAIREALEKIVEAKEGFESFPAANAQEAYHIIQKYNIDLFILDINLEREDHVDRSGFYFAKNVRNISRYAFTPIIFVTSMSSMEILLYREVHCYQYISKPFTGKEVSEILDKAVAAMGRKIYEKSPKWIVRKEGVCYPLNICDTVYVESVLRSLRVQLDGESLEVPYMKLEDALKELQNYGFIQCHRSIIVNIEYIDRYDSIGHCLYLNGLKERVDVGRTYVERFNEIYGVDRKRK